MYIFVIFTNDMVKRADMYHLLATIRTFRQQDASGLSIKMTMLRKLY